MKENSQKKFICVRYILPLAVLVVAAVVAFIPSYRFVVDGSLGDAVSAFDLMRNSFDTSRNMLFGSEEASELAVMSSKIFLTMLAVGCVGMLISLAVAIYSVVMTMRYFFGDNESAIERERALFITLLPNRIVLCACELLVFLLFAFPYALPFVYRGVFGQKVTMALVSVDPFMILIAGFLAVIIISCTTAPMERKLDVDVFKKRKAFEPEKNELSIEEEESNGDNVALSKEQNEFIRYLLREKEQTSDEKTTEEKNSNGDK